MKYEMLIRRNKSSIARAEDVMIRLEQALGGRGEPSI